MSKKAGGLEDVAGRWKVTETEQDANEASRELIGLVVVVESQGEVSWQVPPGAPEGVLLFETNSAHFNKNTLTFLGGEQGWSLSFNVKGEPRDGWMVLESDSAEESVGFSLSLVKEDVSGQVMDGCFSLKKALDESFFSDISFVCSDGGKVLAHRVVLAAAYPDMQESAWLSLFQRQPADMGHLLLSCVYTDSLPPELTVARAKQMVLWLTEQPLMERLTVLASAFIQANNLKQKLMCLIDELLVLLQEAKRTLSTLTMTDSVMVMYTVKQLSREAALGGAKVCLLCQLYTKNKREMSKTDRREVLEYLRARVVMFMDLVKELALEAVEKWENLSQDEQLELATDLIPDVEQVWDRFLQYAADIQTSLLHSLEGRSGEAQRGAGVNMVLHLLFRRSERKRLQKLRREFLESVEMAQGKRERWKLSSDEAKAGQVVNVVSKLINEAEELQVSMETRKRQLLLESGLEWKAFRSYVDIACMYMTWGQQKALALKDHLKHLLFEGLKFVGKTEVNEVAVYLGLLAEVELETWLDKVGGEQSSQALSGKLPVPLSQARSAAVQPCTVGSSALAEGCMQLTASQEYADMEFVLGETVIPAHRVIVASRCEWACKALLSGMKEDREKRIIVSDVEGDVFRCFISYLYGAPLGTAAMTTAAVVDLMAVADRFDESRNLVRLCEALLVKRIEDSSVFQLLTVAETFNTRSLRESTMQYILQRPEVIVEVDGFSSLTEPLQQEIRDLLSGTQDPTLALRHSCPHSSDITPLGADSSGASSEDDEELQLESSSVEWDTALESLRCVVGSEVTDDVLRDLLLAADMDVNRAVNFFLNAQ